MTPDPPPDPTPDPPTPSPPSHSAPADDVLVPDLVRLDRDHPGFRDPVYRARRNAIAQAALDHHAGDPVPEIAYSDAEHDVWRIALAHLAPLHARYACAEFHARWPRLGFAPDRVPSFADVNRALLGATGFCLAPVAGLVTPRVFMSHLADRVFLATQYMRHHSAPLYTPEPDVIHELVGHAALLAEPRFAELNRRFGLATRAAGDDTTIVDALIRVYWYALEFGVVRNPATPGALQVIGAGLLSSFGELGRFETEATLRAFDIAAVAATPFDPTDYQRTLFVGASADDLLGRVEAWLDGVIAGCTPR